MGALLASCAAVGPDFQTPALPAGAAVADYTPAPLPGDTASATGPGGAAQHLSFGEQIPAQWWSLFQSPPLDELVRGAIAQSPNLVSAQAALRNAQELLNAQSGALRYPNVSAKAGAERERATALSSGSPGGGVFNVYNASVDVSYTVDAFGSTRRTLEGLQAGVDYQNFQVEAAYLTLTSNLVTTAIKEASLRAQLQATREVLDAQQQQLDVLNGQFDAGAIPRATVLTQQTQLAQTRATLPPLEKQLAQTRHQLAVYAGRLPNEAGSLPEFSLDSLQLPQQLPVSLPSSLARQRPDVQASEALLHQASAQVGVATANLYPQIQLSASLGALALTPAGLLERSNTLWSLVGGLTQPIFNGGSLNAQRRAAVAAYDEATAQYRGTVLNAFQNVADALRALDADAATLKVQAEAEALARESLELSRSQYQLGGVSYLSLLTAQQAWLQTHVALVQAQAARYADTAALFSALGGGWWQRGALADAQLAPAPAASASTP